MPAVVYRITLQDPAILTALEGEPNSAVSYDFIPGSVIRGLVIGAYIRNQQQKSAKYELDAKKWDTEGNETVEHRMFFSRQTRYLNAYPVINEERGLPVPASWKRRKYQETGTIYDDAVLPQYVNEKTKSLSGFTVVTSGRADIYTPRRVLNVHTQRARSDSGEQQVYRYDALAAEQTFEGVILCDNPDDAANLRELLMSQSSITIGGARSAGYGLGRIDSACINNEWIKAPQRPGETIVLTLLSDMILRDANGEYAPAPAALCAALGQYGITCALDQAWLQTTLVGGFNRKWGLPLPQTPAIERGSVIRLRAVHAGVDALHMLVQEGIGERTNEGFGRVAINWQQHETLTLSQFEQPFALPTAPSTEESDSLWQRIQQRSNERLIEDKFIHAAFLNDDYRIKGPITRSQLARLRTKIANALRNKNPTRQVLREFLENIKGKAAGKQFDNAYVGHDTLTHWLEAMFNEDAEDTIILCFVDAVLERALKERTREAKGKRNRP
jgi:CRISPR-associated protein Csx10